jgi:hypothetical protein
MNLIRCIAMSIAVATVIVPVQAEPPSSAAAAPSVSEPQKAFGALSGAGCDRTEVTS